MLTDSGQIDYEGLVAEAMRDAMRGVIRQVIGQVAKTGLPGEHHFFISFDTTAPGVVMSKRLKERYPQEMTIVLQHRFWDLAAHADRFEVKLQFNAIPERLVVPYAAIKVFVDPSVRFGHQFEEPEDANAAVAGHDDAPVARPERKRAPARKRLTEVGSAPPSNQEQTLPQPPAIVAKGPAVVVEQLPEAKPDPASAPGPGTAGVDASGAEAPAAAGSDEPKVIRLDKFRKK